MKQLCVCGIQFVLALQNHTEFITRVRPSVQAVRTSVSNSEPQRLNHRPPDRRLHVGLTKHLAQKTSPTQHTASLRRHPNTRLNGGRQRFSVCRADKTNQYKG